MHHTDPTPLERGLATRRQVLGDDWVDQSLARLNTFNASYQRLVTTYAWDAIWNRPGLDRPTRRLLVLAITAAMGRWDEFELHARTGLQADPHNPDAAPVSPDALAELLLQVGVYAGVPAANTGMAIAQKLLQTAGHTPEPTTLHPSANTP